MDSSLPIVASVPFRRNIPVPSERFTKMMPSPVVETMRGCAVHFTKITNDGRGGSRFEDVEISQASTPYVENTPPLLVSAAVAATGVIFVTTPPEVRETKPHPAPGRQFAVILEGQAEIVTTDGGRRTFTPGMLALFEDVDGQGHMTNVVSPTPLTFMAVPIAD